MAGGNPDATPNGKSCPSDCAQSSDDRIVLAHGGGGRLTHQLIEKIFLPRLRQPHARTAPRRRGSAAIEAGSRLAFTTDSFVVRPLIFPGGTIGDLAVYGTVNDLAMCGARPLYLSAGFILEEGLADGHAAHGRRIHAASCGERAGVQLVTGDTKVVDHGKGDGIFVNTSGIGLIDASVKTRSVPARLKSETPLSSAAISVATASPFFPSAKVWNSNRQSQRYRLRLAAVEALLDAGIEIHCLRDLTRGGLATTLNEIAADRNICIQLEEALIPVQETVQSACEILGLDPLYVANEGRFAVFVPAAQFNAALES